MNAALVGDADQHCMIPGQGHWLSQHGVDSAQNDR